MRISAFLITICCFLSSLNSVAQQKIWGLTSTGGSSGKGTVFTLEPDGSNLQVVHEFKTPVAGYKPVFPKLLEADNGKLYGLTSEGGSFNVGVLFEYTPATNQYIVKANFDWDNGAYPQGSLLQASDGLLYGMTSMGGANAYGVIFTYAIETEQFSVVHNFSYPLQGGRGSLIEVSPGVLYGMSNSVANGSGQIFSYNTQTGEAIKRHDLEYYASGSAPTGDLYKASNGNLYGMTPFGGSNGYGVLFEYNLEDQTLKKLHDFGLHDSGLFSPGARPYGNVIELPGQKLYGVTHTGGEDFYSGILFEYDLVNHKFSIKKSLQRDHAGQIYTHGAGTLLIGSNGNLYGMGVSGDGITEDCIFEYDLKKDSLIFTRTYTSHGSLTLASNGKFYALTDRMGINGATVFEFDPTINKASYKVELDYASEGAIPQGNLVQARGNLYGVTELGGSLPENYGVLFKIDPLTNEFTKVLDFKSNAGRPRGGLVYYGEGRLFGAATWGTGSAGSIFEYRIGADTIHRVIYFDATDAMTPNKFGIDPMGSLTIGSNGKLYGLTRSGGLNRNGVLYEFDPAGNNIISKISFNGSNGSLPTGSLVLGTDNHLYGVTQQGGLNNTGTLFQYNTSTAELSTLHNFGGSIGLGGPVMSTLYSGTDGLLYGITTVNGNNGSGTIFSYNVDTKEFTYLHHFAAEGNGRPFGNVIDFDGKLVGLSRDDNNMKLGQVFQFNKGSGAIEFKDPVHTYNMLTATFLTGLTLVDPFFNPEEAKPIAHAFPNPAQSEISFDTSLKIYTVSFADLTGKRVKEITSNKENPGIEKVSITDLNPGIYIVTLVTQDNQSVRIKVLKR